MVVRVYSNVSVDVNASGLLWTAADNIFTDGPTTSLYADAGNGKTMNFTVQEETTGSSADNKIKITMALDTLTDIVATTVGGVDNDFVMKDCGDDTAATEGMCTSTMRDAYASSGARPTYAAIANAFTVDSVGGYKSDMLTKLNSRIGDFHMDVNGTIIYGKLIVTETSEGILTYYSDVNCTVPIASGDGSNLGFVRDMFQAYYDAQGPDVLSADINEVLALTGTDATDGKVKTFTDATVFVKTVIKVGDKSTVDNKYAFGFGI